MAITKLSITGNTTSVGISSTPIVVSLGNTAQATTVTPSGNITATNAQTALEQLDTVKAQASGGTLTNPSISGNVSVTGNASITGDITASSLNLGDTNLTEYVVGTWTPQINLGVTLTNDYARVVRIGDICHIFFKFTNMDLTAMTGNGTDELVNSGLPYSSLVDGIGFCKRIDWTNFAVGTHFRLSVEPSTATIKIAHGDGYNNLTKDDINNTFSDAHLIGVITYQVA
mgnify:CR=1 FL=1